MPNVRFTQGYNHTWPSRAVTCFPAGYEGNVKREVAEAAIALGRAERVDPAPPANAIETGGETA